MSALSDTRNALFVLVTGDGDDVEELAAAVASVTHGHYYDPMTAASDWTPADEAAHPRDSEGKFTKKGTGAGGLAELLHHASTLKTGIVAVNSSAGTRMIKTTDGKFRTQQFTNGKWLDTSGSLSKAEATKLLSVKNYWQLPSAKVTSAYGVTAAKKIASKKSPAAATPAITAKQVGKPYVNTNVIYKQTYADQQVIAEKTGVNVPERLIWDAKKKKFILQGQTPTGTWLTAAEFGKGAAYDKFSKQEGWQAPAAVAAAPKPLHINTNVIYTQKYADGAVIAEKTDTTGKQHRLVWSADKKKFILEKRSSASDDWKYVNEYGKGEAYKYFSKQTGWQTPSALASLKSLAAAQLKATSAVTPAAKTLDDMSTAAPVLPGAGGKPLSQLTPDEFDEWFNDNIGSSKTAWDALSPDEQDAVHAAANVAAEDGLFGPLDNIALWKLQDQEAGVKPLSAAQAALSDPATLATWVKAQTLDDWNNFTASEREAVRTAVQSGPLVPLAAANSKIAGWDTDNGHAVIDIIGDFDDDNVPTQAFAFNGWFSGSIHNSDIWSALSPNLKKALLVRAHDASDAGYGESLNKIKKWDTELGLNVVTTPKSTINPLAAPVVTAPAVTAPPVKQPKGYAQHVQVTQGIKFVGDIGQPKPGVYTYNQTTAAGMHDIQAKSKTSWTPAQASAVSAYTTSGGYQSMNGVLRNDPTRLELFSEDQLKQATANAWALQDAMSPLAESLVLHRGTGAQQFGFPDKHVSTADLKKLEGRVIRDRGFVSTSVTKPDKIDFDYAKKPIKVIIRAPEGTPAVYVSSVTPGWKKENELILGAGTSFRVHSVRSADVADKSNYGDHTEQVVILEVVPTLSKPQPKPLPGAALLAVTPTTPAHSGLTVADLSTGTPSSELNAWYAALTQGEFNALNDIEKSKLNIIAKSEDATGNPIPLKYFKSLQMDAVTPSAVSTPLKSQGLPAGTPIKLNTKVIHTTKYAHATVVAVKPNPSGLNQRLTWHVPSKKFLLQEEATPGAGDWKLLPPGKGQTVFTKADAYKTFSKQTGWVTPEPGATAFGSQMFGSAPTPSVSTTVSSPASLVNAPLTLTPKVKTASMDAVTLQKMHGTPPALTNGRISKLYSDFKDVNSATLMSPPSSVFTALKQTLDKHNATADSTTKLNLLQLLKIIDQKSTPPGVSNASLYEKKIVKWLQTPSGKNAATKLWNADAADADALTGGPGSVPEPSTIGVPSTTATVFPPLSKSQAQVMQNQMNAAKPWTNSQQHALTQYTGYDHVYMNAALRQAGPGWPMSDEERKKWRNVAKNAQAGMRPAPRSITVYRKTEKNALPNITNKSSFADIKALEGKVFSDKGFGSTSINQNTWSGSTKYIIEVPEGTPIAWVDDISENQGEQEILLAAGTKYLVQRVEKTNAYSDDVTLYVRVVP